jgi:hypothetical protein
MLLRRFFPVLWLLSCAPQSADRATLTDAFDPRSPDARASGAEVGGNGGNGGDGGMGGAGGLGGIVDARPEASSPRDTLPSDRMPDRPADRMPDAPLPPIDGGMPADAGDAAPDAGPPGPVMLVVGDPAMLSMGDTRIRGLLTGRGLTVRLVDDNAMAVVTGGVSLVVIAGSCASATVAAKYRDVPVPVMSMELAAFDDMGWTGPTMDDFGEIMSGSVSIVMPDHPMAAGLTGTIGVVSTPANFGWGRPSPAAQRVATLQGMGDRATIFGYTRGAMTVSGQAVARRVGFFASDASAPFLGPNGVALFNAAVSWALTPDP